MYFILFMWFCCQFLIRFQPVGHLFPLGCLGIFLVGKEFLEQLPLDFRRVVNIVKLKFFIPYLDIDGAVVQNQRRQPFPLEVDALDILDGRLPPVFLAHRFCG